MYFFFQTSMCVIWIEFNSYLFKINKICKIFYYHVNVIILLQATQS